MISLPFAPTAEHVGIVVAGYVLLPATSGVVEGAAVASLLLGVGERLAALSLVPVMVVAIAYVGLDWNNLAVLGGSLAIVLLETGAESAPGRVRRGLSGGAG